jgi:hypothetical protein
MPKHVDTLNKLEFSCFDTKIDFIMNLLNNASQQTSMYSTGARLKAGASL